ncbi:WAS/WASL-interacting protein family member 2 isoform X2 [Anthonomus grandis grandis]|uniref:WAS/WASL-interacting protein family member 2 isoform X2 n=1 Tax=Anthonomus grandis grandis TaxID=2921223 RepID=UPI002165240C|nr:WAS/WASL-interacting protein family member 2 isoform X2 [Anthonomus grandis grandis]
MPPPPPPGPPPPPANFSLPKLGGGGGADNRGALLSSIRQGTKLKKTVTNDKSAPLIAGKVGGASNNNSGGGNHEAPMVNKSAPNGLPLAGLFAGGMPKLKATGRLGSSTLLSNNVNNNEVEKGQKSAAAKNFNSIQDQLKRQLHHPSDTRTRGPPPPAPMRNISEDNDRPILQQQNSANGSLQPNVSRLHANNSTLHRKSKSNANLTTLDATDNGTFRPPPVINHGKPNLAPKPPVLNGKPAPPTALSMNSKKISRAQSMRTPRSPSPQSPTQTNEGIKFGTVRNMSSLIGQSLTNLNSSASPRPRPPLTNRPSVPPPSVPPPAVPQQKPALSVKPPSHAPPPPPTVAAPQPPNHAPPPPPPHKTTQALSQPSRPPPAVPTNNSAGVVNPPPPPPRHSSMRDVNQTPRRAAVDLEEKFRGSFSTPDRFPRPPPYRNVLKLYSNRQAIGKQQAPLPPQQNKLWNPTSTC